MENFPAWADYLLALIFGVLLPFISGVRSAEAFKQMSGYFDSRMKVKFYLGNSFFLFLTALIVIVVWLLYQRPLEKLGFINPSSIGRTIPWWMIGAFLFLYIMDIIKAIYSDEESEKTKSELDNNTPFMPSTWKDLPAYTVMCVSAGVFEEIVFRGFLISFFQAALNGIPSATAWALITPAVIFSLAHYYQGAKAVFKILVLSLLFGMIFWHTRSLYAVMILHFFIDFAGGVLSILLHAKNRKA